MRLSLSSFISNFEETIEKELDKDLVASDFEEDTYDGLEPTSDDVEEDL